MDRSKIVVISLVVIIIAGVSAWSWVNMYQTPEFDPEEAASFAGFFFIHCEAEYDDEFCATVVGTDHRRCFEDHVEMVSSPDDDDGHTLDYDRRGYLDCMDRAVEQRLSAE